MKRTYYTQLSGQFIYSLFYSSKKRKLNRFRKHHHTETELGLILEGSGEYNLNGKAYTINAGDLFIVRSNEQHCIPTITSDTLIAFNMHISSYFFWNQCSDYIPPNKIQALINSDIPIQNRHSDKEITDRFLKIAELCASDAEDDAFELRCEVLNTIKLISEKIDVDTVSDAPPVSCIVDIQNAVGYIKNNFRKPISLDDIAKNAAMSRSYLSNTFKKVTGMSPYNYLITTRIENAVELLKDTDKTVIDISLECGFTSLTSFNKSFKRLVGISPTELRSGIIR